MNISSVAQDRKHWRILQTEIRAADKSATWYLFTPVITLLQIGRRAGFVKVPERDMANLLFGSRTIFLNGEQKIASQLIDLS